VETLRDGTHRCPMSLSIFSTFKCPQVRCRTFYAVTPSTESPDQVPRCVVCITPFLARDGTSYLHYLFTSDAVDVRAD
jgi:hypothetical protein